MKVTVGLKFTAVCLPILKLLPVAFGIKHMSKDIGNNESCISACWRKELEIWKGEDKNEFCYNELKLRVAVWVHNF